MTTTGLNTAARVLITSSAPTLILSNTNTAQRLTYQIEAEVTDVAGNVQSDVELFYTILAGHDVATLSDSGLVTAEAPGKVIVQVSAAALNNTIGVYTPAGVPVNAIFAEQTIQVTEGYVLPDFQFTLDYADGTFTIAQSAVANSTWDETVTYTLGATNANPTVLGAIAGNGTLTFTGPNPTTNFTVQGTCAVSGTYHQVWTGWGWNPAQSSVSYPVPSSGGLNAGPNGHSDSGQPYAG